MESYLNKIISEYEKKGRKVAIYLQDESSKQKLESCKFERLDEFTGDPNRNFTHEDNPKDDRRFKCHFSVPFKNVIGEVSRILL